MPTPDTDLEFAFESNAAVQLTEGTDTDYDAILEEHAAKPILEADAHENQTNEEFDETYATQTPAHDPDAMYDSHMLWMDVIDHLKESEGTFLLRNFDAITDEETARTLSHQIKAVFEQTNATIVVTAEDTNALFKANPDLRGRIRTVDILQ